MKKDCDCSPFFVRDSSAGAMEFLRGSRGGGRVCFVWQPARSVEEPARFVEEPAHSREQPTRPNKQPPSPKKKDTSQKGDIPTLTHL